jgi:hypothetical protein
MRLTTAQSLVRWMVGQRAELLDGTGVPLFAWVFAIFGQGTFSVSVPPCTRSGTICPPGAGIPSRGWRRPRSPMRRRLIGAR